MIGHYKKRIKDCEMDLNLAKKGFKVLCDEVISDIYHSETTDSIEKALTKLQDGISAIRRLESYLEYAKDLLKEELEKTGMIKLEKGEE